MTCAHPRALLHPDQIIFLKKLFYLNALRNMTLQNPFDSQGLTAHVLE